MSARRVRDPLPPLTRAATSLKTSPCLPLPHTPRVLSWTTHFKPPKNNTFRKSRPPRRESWPRASANAAECDCMIDPTPHCTRSNLRSPQFPKCATSRISEARAAQNLPRPSCTAPARPRPLHKSHRSCNSSIPDRRKLSFPCPATACPRTAVFRLYRVV